MGGFKMRVSNVSHVIWLLALCGLITLSVVPLYGGSRLQTVLVPPVEIELDPVAGTSTFYLVRSDLRRCASPMCGGFFVRRVNLPQTKCANGKSAEECYVAEINWNGHEQVEPGKALLRGTITTDRHTKFGSFGRFNVTEVWQAAGDAKPSDDFFRVRDRGVRCIAAPCPTHHEAKLNSTVSANIAGVDLSGAHADDDTMSAAFEALTGADGIIAAGVHEPVRGPAGVSKQLKAVVFYLKPRASQAKKPCIKTGCSKQICSDHTVMSTCEWREEYACYTKATCERQADGNCGFTKTKELTECLNRK
jgi:hypothetical protein